VIGAKRVDRNQDDWRTLARIRRGAETGGASEPKYRNSPHAGAVPREELHLSPM
jgi:hypothetical protein